MTKRLPTRQRRLALAVAAGLITPMAAVSTAQAGFGWEWETGSPYYEDDAWYDVSEWFDGNDYNPTDEAIGRWDNETYDRDEALTSGDSDNDIDWTNNDHGYYADTKSSDTWFYDYYDHGYSDYGDSNNDGNYSGVIATAGSRHAGGAHVLMGDGAVKFITESIDTGNLEASTVCRNGPGLPPGSQSPYGVWGALGTRDVKEVVDFEL